MSKWLEGKVAVIPGGSGGIGVATAQRLAAEGATIVVCGQSDIQKAQRVVKALPGQGHLAKGVAITDSQALAALASEINAAFGCVNFLLNRAGFTKPVKHADLDALTDELIMMCC